MRIEVYADIACPWCYIGERRLERVLDELPELHFERIWRPFQLQPDLPAQGIPWPDFVARKFGGPARAQAMFAQVQRAAREDGITYDFDKVPVAPNTAEAHRLVLFASRSGRTWEVVDALFAAYFTYGRDITDTGVLVEIAARSGLDAAETRAFLSGDEARAEVVASQAEAERLGITGVPFFVFDGRYGLSGAQPVEVFRNVIESVRAQRVAS